MIYIYISYTYIYMKYKIRKYKIQEDAERSEYLGCLVPTDLSLSRILSGLW